MKKTIVILIVVALLLIAGYFLIYKKSVEPVVETDTGEDVAPSEEFQPTTSLPFDIDDNLDEAISDLDFIE